MSRMVIREVNLLVLIREFARDGELSVDAIPDSILDEWCRLPLTHVWAMGVWKRSSDSRRIAATHVGLQGEYTAALPGWSEADVSGSPYAIGAFEFDDAIGGEDAFMRFRERLSERGVGLILDFVPNHVAVDHPWVFHHPDRFVSRSDYRPGDHPPPGWFTVSTRTGTRWMAHGRDPYFAAWTDTAQLDYRDERCREAMADEVVRIAKFCDGVRCDMAMLVLNSVFRKTWGAPAAHHAEFWPLAIDRVHAQHPNFVFIAEGYWGTENRLIEYGFDAVYDKDFSTRAVEASANEIRSTMPERRAWGVRRVRFLENHDEPRIAAQVDCARLKLLHSLLFMQPGHVLWHEGQEHGFRTRLPVQLNRRPDEPGDAECHDYFLQFCEWIREFPFTGASAQVIGVNPTAPDDKQHETLIPVLWKNDQRILLWVGNLSHRVAYGRIPLHLSGVAGRSVRLRDVRDNTEFLRDGNELLVQGLFVQLAGDTMHWFEVEVIPVS